MPADLSASGSMPRWRENLLTVHWGFLAYRILLPPTHQPDMTEILLQNRKSSIRLYILVALYPKAPERILTGNPVKSHRQTVQTQIRRSSDQSLQCLLTGFFIKNKKSPIQNRSGNPKMTNGLVKHITMEELLVYHGLKKTKILNIPEMKHVRIGNSKTR